MKALAASLLIAAMASAPAADAVTRAVALCMDIPLDGVPVSETFAAGGWERADRTALPDLVAPHACGDPEKAAALMAQFTQTLDFSGGLFRKSGVTVLAADNRGGDIVDRLCFITSANAAGTTALMADLPVAAPASQGYSARETAPDNIVEAFGWRGDHQIHAGRCANSDPTDAIKIRRLLRKIPQ
ncbi:MAG: hypothetical protein AAGA47_11545 [Pseudomonadota bacterium]